ncbi:guanine nucleotide-binding protein G(I)/G(S)/G(O) subunit gamma-13-like [Branchiostoma floridae]|uniref:Guanine nucleotide-binding protein G(I)/G(S)/G(O) subunit gamma-13-like n=1 Tax=Branchiostoma floridae TaxID=7739 RepID=A0A9J7M802_BRAFL|nr:guanine nucleotide-binding protein G(I)/G(S)/G(O) subunit gamma-13-like [Branchiostoma floridae]
MAEPEEVPEMTEEERLTFEVKTLKYQLGQKRIMMSESIPDLIKFVEERMKTDYMLHPPAKSKNPWAEKSKCVVL